MKAKFLLILVAIVAFVLLRKRQSPTVQASVGLLHNVGQLVSNRGLAITPFNIKQYTSTKSLNSTKYLTASDATERVLEERQAGKVFTSAYNQALGDLSASLGMQLGEGPQNASSGFGSAAYFRLQNLKIG